MYKKFEDGFILYNISGTATIPHFEITWQNQAQSVEHRAASKKVIHNLYCDSIETVAKEMWSDQNNGY